ncbi:DUF134 domain-containing protein [Dethiothermospora halolimnae]|uniref:DUF134 domain-containing protein n=1 Tax=Dethiothermospora halolimnae TaxID=3114390 RepID=UPI003CCBFD60
MPRPRKCRKVAFIPEEKYFVPHGKSDNDEIIIKIEEVEAMRLKDIEKLSQEECAARMEVSRQTFQNIINSAREKVAKALVEGKSIRIKGGNFSFKQGMGRCKKCRKRFNNGFSVDKECPKCKIKE